MPTKILLLSDTHGHMDDVILKYANQADEIWHAGDIGYLGCIEELKTLKPFRAVYGNIDGNSAKMQYPLHQKFTCEKVKVWITHIGGYPTRYAPGIKQVLIEEQPKIFICGHSHILKVQYDKELNVLHINPGAAGKSGFHQIRTMLRFVIDGSDIKDLEIIELGKRS